MLFFTGFLSATLLPGGSEAALLAALSLGQDPVVVIIVIATVGNTLGGLTNYWLGLWLPNRTQRENHGHKAIAWIEKYGYWALLMSWMPVLGDPLCLAAGWLRLSFYKSALAITIGKAARYGILSAIYFGIF